MSSTEVPFSIRLSDEHVATSAGSFYLAADRRVVGLARLEPDALVVQFAESRHVVHVLAAGGVEQRRESDVVSDRRIPLEAISGARVAWGLLGPRLVVTTSDLRALAGMPGANGAELRLRIARRHRTAASELVAELQLQLADLALRRAEADRQLPR
ncbi:MAG TPA: hypothetical protein VFS08_17030 [Gemmatimonadaceae bacterium]|nr:hypothetical protein [Gemmatimonadaceae bacterium]